MLCLPPRPTKRRCSASVSLSLVCNQTAGKELPLSDCLLFRRDVADAALDAGLQDPPAQCGHLQRECGRRPPPFLLLFAMPCGPGSFHLGCLAPAAVALMEAPALLQLVRLPVDGSFGEMEMLWQSNMQQQVVIPPPAPTGKKTLASLVVECRVPDKAPRTSCSF